MDSKRMNGTSFKRASGGMPGKECEGREHQQSLYAKACRYLPGGVNSPVRSFRAVGGRPFPVRGGRGSRLIDAEGKEYVDLVMGWGALILGHAHPAVQAALNESLSRGWHFGALSEDEVELAARLCEAVSGLEMVRLVNSGTEAVMSAVRLARAYTGRSKVVKFEPCYHGHSDGLLATGGEGCFRSRPASLGVPQGFIAETLILPFNRPDSLESVFETYAGEIAAVILEPVPGNAGVILPEEGMLSTARMMCDKHGSLLVLDEVITGFRFAYGDCGGMLGAQGDIVCLGKVIGGGFPIGAYGGRKEIMELVAPLGGVYQAGTFSGNLASVTAGLRTLSLLEEERPYPYLERLGASLEEGLMERAGKAGLEAEVTRFGSMLSLSFRAVEGKEDGRAGDASPYSIFFHKMLDMGFYLPPSPSESWFLSFAHSEDDVARLLEGSEKAFREVRRRS